MKILFVSTEPTMYVANNFLTSLEPNLVNRLEVDDWLQPTSSDTLIRSLEALRMKLNSLETSCQQNGQQRPFNGIITTDETVEANNTAIKNSNIIILTIIAFVAIFVILIIIIIMASINEDIRTRRETFTTSTVIFFFDFYSI